MRKKIFVLLPLLLFIVIAYFLWRGLGLNPHALPSALIGKPVPAFAEEDLFDQKNILKADIFNGQIVLLNVWATWCIACRSEHPVLMDLANKDGILIYGINYKDKRSEALAWLHDYGNPYKKVIYDPKGSLGINLGVYGAPETYLIDQKGIIRFKYTGPISPEAWQEEIRPRIAALRGGE